MNRVVLAASFVVASASFALGQAPGARFREAFLQLDANGDTVLERDEVPESAREAFDRLVKRGDTNGNGKLEADELRALGQKASVLADPGAVANRFQMMDKDGDGKLTRAEFTGVPTNFDRMDADKDGSLTKDEMQKFVAANAPKAKAQAKKKQDSARKDEPKKDEKAASRPKPDTDDTIDPALRFKRLDKDGDGRISQDEFLSKRLFERMDADRDGFLSPGEMEKFMKGPKD